MTGTLGSQLFGPWYDVLGGLLMAGVFFYLAFAQETFTLAVKQRIPAFLSKRVCIVFGLCGVGLALFHLANMPAPRQALPDATVAAFGTAPDWQVILTGEEGETLSIDRKTIVRNGNTVGYSEQLVYKTPKPNPVTGTMASIKSRLLVNCADRTRVLQELVLVRADGSAVFQDKSSAPLVMPLSTDPSRPEYISSNYLCGPRDPAPHPAP